MRWRQAWAGGAVIAGNFRRRNREFHNGLERLAKLNPRAPNFRPLSSPNLNPIVPGEGKAVFLSIFR
jgi:hypothetical protein